MVSDKSGEASVDGRTFNELHVFQSKTAKRLAIEVTAEFEAVLDRRWPIKGGGHAGSEYIVPTRTGKPYTSEGFRACWQRVRIKWGRSGGQPLHCHDIRALLPRSAQPSRWHNNCLVTPTQQ